MVISEMIKQLQDAKTIHGDVPVALKEGATGSWFNAKRVVIRHSVEKGVDSDVQSEFFAGINL